MSDDIERILVTLATMPLDEHALLQSYQMLHQVFPEDLHIARPLIQMLQHREQQQQAADLALSVARRMLASGKSTYAIAFLSLCQQLGHPDKEGIQALSDMARFSTGTHDLQQNKDKEQTFTLLDQLSDAEAKNFIRQAQLIQTSANQAIVRQGESSNTFYLILDGAVDVQISLQDGRVKTLKRLGAGDFFGEFSCVYKLRRSATVSTTTTSLLLEFSDQAIAALMQDSPMAGAYLMRTVQTRLVHAMTHTLPAFAELPEADHRWAAEESTLHEYQAGQPIVISDKSVCHILLSGHATLQQPGNQDVILTNGCMFGALNHYIRLPSEASIIATEHTLICHMPENIFHSFMNVYASFEQQVKVLGACFNNQRE